MNTRTHKTTLPQWAKMLQKMMMTETRTKLLSRKVMLRILRREKKMIQSAANEKKRML